MVTPADSASFCYNQHMADETQSGPALYRYIARLVENLRRLVPAALGAWELEAIHDARVATRRLKAALDVLEPRIPRDLLRPFARKLRRLRRTLGPLRDLDVMLGHLGERWATRRHARAARRVAEFLEQRRTRRQRRCGRRSTAQRMLLGLLRWEELSAEVRQACLAVGELLGEALEREGAELSRCADALATADAMSDSPASVQDPHVVRIALKRFRYTVELSREAGWPCDKQTVRLLKRMQDALGLWHDYAVLAEEIMRVAIESQSASHDVRFFGELIELARAAWRRAEAQLRRFVALWSQDGAALRRTVETPRATAGAPDAVTGADSPAAPGGSGSDTGP